MQAVRKQNIIITWIAWQFYEMPAFLISVWGNYLKFAENYFSVGYLLRTLISPWRRYQWAYPRSFDPYQFSLTLVSNVFSRFLGALMRIVLIAAGLVFYVLVALAGLLIIAGWIIMPFAIIGGFFLSSIYVI